MGGLDDFAALLWSPAYVALMVGVVAAIGVILRALAPVSFSALGARNCLRGGFLMILWVFILSIAWSGLSTTAMLAFSIAAYFSAIGVMAFCAPLAMVLARCNMYRFGWFVSAGMVLLLGAALAIEISTGPEVSNGIARWQGGVPALLGVCLPALVAFAVGARLPLRSDKGF